MNKEPTESIASLGYDEWLDYLRDQAQRDWHYVTIGPICNCFSTCMTCEVLGYVTHKGADWEKGPWVKYTGPMYTKEEQYKLTNHGFAEDEIEITSKPSEECKNPCHKKEKYPCRSCSNCPPRIYTVTHKESGLEFSAVSMYYSSTVDVLLQQLRKAVGEDKTC